MEKTIILNIVNLNIKKEYPAGITLEEIKDDLFKNRETPFITALVNNRSRSLNYPIYFPRRIEFLDITSSSGHRSYRQSLTFLLFKAIQDLYPGASLRIEHAISGGYYCHVNHLELDNEKIAPKLKQRMVEIIAEDLPFNYHTEETADVLKKFETQKLCDKVALIKEKGDIYTSYYSLDKTIDSFYYCLVPSTAYLKVFDLIPYHKGLLLVPPEKNISGKLAQIKEHPKLLEVFSEFAEWNKTLGLSNISDINAKSDNKNIFQLIMLAEALQERKVVKIVDMITAAQKTQMILISGPSSSGKTTFGKRLALQLKLSGLQPINISLDDYYVDREKSPLDENGEFDYEHINALNIELLNKQLQDLLDGKDVFLPKYSFKEGNSVLSDTPTRLNKNEILVIEGIHALNPQLTALISDDVKFKIYVSALTTISLDNHNYISTRDNRLIRRIIRDYFYRNTSAEDNILRWPSVIQGEDKWIYPYQEEANVMFNSSLLFELPVLKAFIEPMLKEVKHSSYAYPEARRLLKFMSYFKAIDHRKIPPTSLLREFFGGSSFKY